MVGHPRRGPDQEHHVRQYVPLLPLTPPPPPTCIPDYETPDAYAAFQRSATCCPELQKAVSVPHEATFDAILSPPAGKVLGAAPIIEVAKLQLKAGVTREAWLAQMVLMQKLLDAIDACKGYAAGFVEGNDDYLILVGWDTVESHTEWMKGEKATPGSPVHDFGAMIETSEMHHIAIREVMPGASRH